jgi:hypothetical protein
VESVEDKRKAKKKKKSDDFSKAVEENDAGLDVTDNMIVFSVRFV